MEINGFDASKALKWLRNYNRQNKDYTDQEIIELASKNFQKETGYTNQRMIPVVKYMWKSQIESQH